MTDSAQRLRDLVDHATGASEPEVALRALVALRDELEAFERLQVARTLDAGGSFGAVARALGISRQAAHRRYRHLAGVALPDPRPSNGQDAPRLLVTSEARAAVQLAHDEAERLGAAAVGSEHLLLGILRTGDRVAALALRAEGVTLEGARAAAQPTLVEGRPAAPRRAERPPGISDHARQAFERALREAIARGDGYVGVDHLLLAAIADSEGGAARTLSALTVSPDAVRRRLGG